MFNLDKERWQYYLWITYRLNAFKTDLSYCLWDLWRGCWGGGRAWCMRLLARLVKLFSFDSWARSFTDYPENPTASLISLFCVVLLFPLYIHSFQWERRQVFLSLHWSVNIWLHITNWDGIDTSLWAVKPISAMLALRDFFYYLHN